MGRLLVRCWSIAGAIVGAIAEAVARIILELFLERARLKIVGTVTKHVRHPT